MPDSNTTSASPEALLELGEGCLLSDTSKRSTLRMPPHHLLTHGIVVGMTGSGKTGLVMVLAEEALRAKVPTLIVDVKGDLPNLLLAYPSFDPSHFLPFAASVRRPNETRSNEAIASELADSRKQGLLEAGIDEPALRAFDASVDVRVITPGSSAGEPLHLLSSLERRSPRWDTDPEAAHASLDAAVSLVLRLLGREPDPAKNAEHVLLSTLAERRLLRGDPADVASLIADVEEPPIERLGAMQVDDYISPHARHELAAALNSLLASTALASWRRGATLDVDSWLTPRDGRTPAVIVSVAHLVNLPRTA